MVKKTQGSFNKTDNFIYFIASGVERIHWGQEVHNFLLVAVNEIRTDKDMSRVEAWIDSGKSVFIDSGIYALAMDHARKHGVSHDIALNLPPGEIDGFDELLERYVFIVRKFGDRCWGYIELDQGGRENKIKTRRMLEDDYGLNPIPVYHPFGDGWDYFDYLAERYDRVCFGNIVQANANERKMLIATAWQRHRKYPDLWLHVLGLTPNELLYAMPINSGDSSSWLSSVRWEDGYRPRACGKCLGKIPKNFKYKLASDAASEMGSRKAIKMAAYGSYMIQKNWNNHLSQMKQLGFDVYPEVLNG